MPKVLCVGLLLMIALEVYGGDSVQKGSAISENRCTYSTWEWNTLTKRSENHKRVSKSYADLEPQEKDPHSDCTVCEEDQVLVEIQSVPSFRVCKNYADDVKSTVRKIIDSGFPVTSVISHRVGRTKGPVDKNGVRTQFSNHSFGTAIDINAEKNGLYTRCYEFGKDCQLLRGGPWKPGQPGTVTKDSIVYQAFKEIGWKWGGELKGQQKDFMHFSLSGD